MKFVPAIDIRAGRCVRLYQGNFERETVYERQAEDLARQYETTGCDVLHVVDLDGARDGRPVNREAILRILDNTGLSVQLGGGIRSESHIRRWLDAGVDRVVIGSLALADPAVIHRCLADYGPGKVVLALDVRFDRSGVPRVATHGWRETSQKVLWDCVEEFLPSGLQFLLCTDISRDGALSGPNLELYGALHEKYAGLRIQASGGVRSVDDMQALKATGVWGAISGRALLEGRITPEEIRSFLHAA